MERCQVHFMRNAMKKVSPKERRVLTEALKEVFGSKDAKEEGKQAVKRTGQGAGIRSFLTQPIWPTLPLNKAQIKKMTHYEVKF